MIMPTDDRYLDQAHDRMAFFFEDTASKYDSYQRGEYLTNRVKHAESWNNHYDHMRQELLRGIKTVIEERDVKRSELNMAIVGSGFNPVECELDKRFIAEQLEDFRSIVLIDFSQTVLAEAAQNLEAAGIPKGRILKMQYDITNGMSTVYEKFIQQMMEKTAMTSMWGLNELNLVAEQIAQVSIDDLRSRLAREKELAEQQSVRPMTQSLIGGGENKDRTLALSVEGEPLSLDLIAYQMVLAGTGASAEDLFWSTYNEALQRVGETSAPTEQQRQIFERIFTLISRFNTEISITSIRDMLRDNPNAYVTAVTDFSTISKTQDHTFERLDRKTMESGLRRDQIHTYAPTDPWVWNDEAEHGHEVRNLIFTKSTKK